MRFRVYVLRTLLAGAALACSAPQPNTNPSPETGANRLNSEGFSLYLNNRNYLDVNVFVQHDGQSSRVGTVTGSSSMTMAVPTWMIGQGGTIRLMAKPIGDHDQFVTDDLVIQPGQSVELNIESSIARSHYSVQ